jgi:hypothetical protein
MEVILKNLILAAAIAVAGAMAVGAPAQAATTVTTVTKTVHRPGYDRPHHRMQRCWVKTVKQRYHHRVVVKKIRTCR